MSEAELLPLCDAQTTLTPDEHARLQGLPEAAHTVVDEPACELQRGHTGPHTALGQESAAGTIWWVAWTSNSEHVAEHEAAARLQQMAGCPAQDPNSAPEDPHECLLFEGHAGAHDFEMESSGPRVPSEWAAQKIAAAAQETLDDDQREALNVMSTLLASQQAPGPLLNRDEALVTIELLELLASDNWIVAELAEELSKRLENRLEALD